MVKQFRDFGIVNNRESKQLKSRRILFRSACRLHLSSTKQRELCSTTTAQIWRLLPLLQPPCFTPNQSQNPLPSTRPSPTANPPRSRPESTSSETRGTTLSRHGRANSSGSSPISAAALANESPAASRWEASL